MKRIIAIAAALAVIGASAPAQASVPEWDLAPVPTPTASANTPKKPVLGPGQVHTPDGKVVTLGTPKPGKAPGGKVVKAPPPTKAGGQIGTQAVCGSPPCRLYNIGSQGDAGSANKNGAWANVKIGGHQGALNGGTDYHTLGEVAVFETTASTGRNIVEIGWIVSPSVNGDYKPTLFVFSWVNDDPGVYNGGTFVPVTGAANVPGVTEYTPGANVVMGLYHQDAGSSTPAGWWAHIGSEWIGYYPDADWTGATPAQLTFNRADFFQFFFEIASTETTPCSDMGLGVVGANAGAARFGSVSYYDSTASSSGTGVNLSTSRVPAVEAGSPYANTFGEGPPGSQRAFRGGGPMWNAAGTGVGTVGQPC